MMSPPMPSGKNKKSEPHISSPRLNQCPLCSSQKGARTVAYFVKISAMTPPTQRGHQLIRFETATVASCPQHMQTAGK